MSDGANAGNLVDPIELWRQWNETAATLWTSALDSTRQAYSSGTSYAWPKGMGNTQEPDESYSALFNNLKEIWQTWFEATMEIWQQAVGKGGPQAALAAQWLKMMEQAQAKLQAGEVLPIDPFTLFRDWYNASSDEWAKSIESALGSEKFLQYSGPLMESYAGVMRAFKLASEAYFKKLQLPTLSDISRVAELVIALEEKVDQFDDRFEDVEQKFGAVASSASVAALQERLNQTATNETLDKLTTQMQHLADGERAATNETLDKLTTQMQHLADGERVARLEQRLAGVEEKLELLLSHIERGSAQKATSTPGTQVKRTRKAPKKDVE